jgi:hypothetical protein
MKPFPPTSPYPPGLGIALVLAALFLILALDVAHLVALGYGGAIAVGHISRARWRI